MSAVETPAPPPAEPVAEPRRCPRCGSALRADQEWCLNCGAEVGATIASPPSWRGPVLLVGGLLALALIALVLALVELAQDAEQVSPQAATPAPTAATTPAPTPQSTTVPPVTPTVAEWPAGTTAWTIVLESSATREAADTRAEELAGQGVAVGVLDSNDFSSLEPNRFVVFSGQYDSRRAADQAGQDLSGQVEGVYVRRVVPESGSGGATPTPSPTAQP